MKLLFLAPLFLLLGTIPARGSDGGHRKLLASPAPYVCIRPLDVPGVPDVAESLLFVHCYVQAGSTKTPSWSTAFDDTGVHSEVNPAHFWRICNKLSGTTVAKLKTAAWSQIRTGNWDAADYDWDDNNCCNYIDAVIRAAGSPKGVQEYFWGYDFPPNFPD